MTPLTAIVARRRNFFLRFCGSGIRHQHHQHWHSMPMVASFFCPKRLVRLALPQQNSFFHISVAQCSSQQATKAKGKTADEIRAESEKEIPLENEPLLPETKPTGATKPTVLNEANKKQKNKTKRKRQMRPLAQNKFGTQKQQQVNCIPLADSFDLEALQEDGIFSPQYYISRVSPKTDNMAIHCTPIAYKNIQAQQHQQQLGEEEEEPELVREFYVFADGVVVFWNIDSYTQEHVIDHLKRFQVDGFNEQLSRSEEETMDIGYTSSQSNATDNTIYLNRNVHTLEQWQPRRPSCLPIAHLERFAFSHAMAVSVRLGVWEQELEDLNDQLEACIDKLKTGKLLWNLKKAPKMIGRVYGIRHSVNCADLLEKDVYWESNELEKLYNNMANRLCINARQQELNKRIDYCENFTKTMQEMLDQKKSHHLEWIIIVLITLEVIIYWRQLIDIPTNIWQFLMSKRRERPTPEAKATKGGGGGEENAMAIERQK